MREMATDGLHPLNARWDESVQMERQRIENFEHNERGVGRDNWPMEMAHPSSPQSMSGFNNAINSFSNTAIEDRLINRGKIYNGKIDARRNFAEVSEQ